MSKYLITFDMDTNCLKRNYHGNNWNNAYADIARVLRKSCKTLRNVWYMSACNGILTGHEAKQP